MDIIRETKDGRLVKLTNRTEHEINNCSGCVLFHTQKYCGEIIESNDCVKPEYQNKMVWKYADDQQGKRIDQVESTEKGCVVTLLGVAGLVVVMVLGAILWELWN